MTSEFAINQVEYGDVAGMGAWSDGHYRQHLRYNAVLAGRSPSVIIPTFPIFYFPIFGGNPTEIKFWLDSHENWHEQIRPFANITGANFADLDYRNPLYFYEWQDTHNAEHALLDSAFGVA